MAGQFIFSRQRLTTCLSFLTCAALILIGTGCGDNKSEQAGTDQLAADSSMSGSASFAIQWHTAAVDRSAAGFVERQAIGDCTTASVASITCQVYDESHNLIASGGPWSCEAHTGRLEGITPGAGRIFAILGWNASGGDGDLIYQGQSAAIAIEPGKIANAGTIDAYSFVPNLSAPQDHATDLPANGFSLTWDSVANAYGYRVLVSGDSGFTTLLIDEQTTETSFTPLNLSASTTYYWTIHSIDQYGNESAAFQTWDFTTSPLNVCGAPVFDPIGNRQTDENTALTFTISASDPDNGPLTYSAGNLPTGAVFNSQSQTFSWTPGYGAAGNYPVTFTVCDDCPEGPLCDSEQVTITVGDVCRPPVLNPIGNRQVDENQSLTFSLNATDPDGGTLTYSAGNLPSGATFNSQTRTFNWTPGYGAAGTYNDVTFTVCDDCSDGPQCDSEQVTITVGDVCRPPVLNSIGNRQVDEDQTLTITLNATDPDNGTLTYSAANLPEGATFNSQTRTFSWTPGYTASGSYDVTFTVCDDCSDGPQCDSEQVNIAVGEVCRSPVLSPIGGRQVDEGQSLTFTLNASDPDGGALTYSAANLPEGATFTSQTRTFSWTPGYGTAGSYEVEFKVCDDCVAAAQCDSEKVPITVVGALPVVTITAIDATAAEAAEFPDTGTFRINRTGSPVTALTVYLTVGGTADNGKDYTPVPTSITLSVDQNNANITVAPIDDQSWEPDETVQLTIAASDAYLTGKPYTATVTIQDDDTMDSSVVVGAWEERIDVGCDGSFGISTLVFRDDYTFDSNPRCSESTGTWSLQGNVITFYYTSCDYPVYTGTIESSGTEMSGTMDDGQQCWSATKN